jgi:hypothetical protein
MKCITRLSKLVFALGKLVRSSVLMQRFNKHSQEIIEEGFI